jgi:hypothetical protein
MISGLQEFDCRRRETAIDAALNSQRLLDKWVFRRTATESPGQVSPQVIATDNRWPTRLASMGLEGLPGLKQRLQAGKNTRPSISAGSVSGIILGPLVMRHCYFSGFGLGHQFDRGA